MTESTAESITPDPEDVREALDLAKTVLEQVDNYRSVAQAIDEKYINGSSKNSHSLEDMPYGEELIRTEDLPENLENAISVLEKIVSGELTGVQANTLYKEAVEDIADAVETIEECTSLPSESDDDE